MAGRLEGGRLFTSCVRHFALNPAFRGTVVWLLLLLLPLGPGFLHAQWQQSNGPYGGDIRTLATSGSNLFAGTNGGGVFLSTNNGSTWAAVNTGLTNLYVYSLTISGSNLFAGTLGISVFRRSLCEIISPVITIDSIQSVSACNASDGKIYITPSVGLVPYTYSWMPGAYSTQDVSGLAPGSYSVTVTDGLGCTSMASQNIYVAPPPTPFSVCITTTDSFSTGNIIIWDKPVSTTIDSFKIYRDSGTGYLPVVKVPYTALSTYTDNVNPNIHSYYYKISAISSGVESVLSNSHETMFLQVTQPNPPANNLTWNDYCGFPVTKYYILCDTFNTNNWVRCDSVSWGSNVYVDATPPSAVINYRIEVEIPIPCLVSIKNPVPMGTIKTTKSNTFKVIGNGINENSLASSLSIYPNPSAGRFTVEVGTMMNQYKIEIHNMMGQKVYESYSAGKKVEVNVNLPKGIYLLQVETDLGRVNKKVIIQ